MPGDVFNHYDSIVDHKPTAMDKAMPFRAHPLSVMPSGKLAAPSSRCAARDSTISCVSVSLVEVDVRVVSFVMFPFTGMGMGLSIAPTIVEAYGGRIWVENKAATGAVVRFTLPLVKV